MLSNTVLLAKAEKLGLYGLVTHWPAIDQTVKVEELLGWEETERSERGLKNRLKRSKLDKFKMLSDFDWDWPTKCDREQIEDIMQLDFLKDTVNIIILGPNGVGKSMIASNIIYQGILSGHTALFVTASQMLNDLSSQDGNHALNRRLKYYASPGILYIDELAYLSYSHAHADLLFEIISRRYQKKSTVVTGNLPFNEWDKIFPNAACVVSLIDRLIHASEIVNIEGPSYRLKEAKEASAKRQKTRSKKKPSTTPNAVEQDPYYLEGHLSGNASIEPESTPEDA